VTDFDEATKKLIEAEIEADFQEAYKGIVQLPKKRASVFMLRMSIITAFSIKSKTFQVVGFYRSVCAFQINIK